MIIDFRVRPPFGSFRRAFPPGPDSALADDDALDAFVTTLRREDVRKAVIMARHVAPIPGIGSVNMSNDDAAIMMARYPDFFVAFGAVDIDNREQAIDDIDHLADLGFRGIAFDNPLAAQPRFNDDEYLFPLYTKAAERKMIIALTSSGLVGSSVNYCHPSHVQAVARAFPNTPVVIPHACWPWTSQAVAAALQSLLQNSSRLYLIPDVYLHTGAPGRKDYEDALRWAEISHWTGNGGHLASRFLYASSFPLQHPGDAVRAFRALKLDPATERLVFYDNAAQLLGLSGTTPDCSGSAE